MFFIEKCFEKEDKKFIEKNSAPLQGSWAQPTFLKSTGHESGKVPIIFRVKDKPKIKFNSLR